MSYIFFELLKVIVLAVVLLRMIPWPLIKKNYWLIFLPIGLGFYFQFLVRVIQGPSFEKLNYYFTGAWIATTDSFISVLTVVGCYRLFSKTAFVRWKKIVGILISSAILFVVIATSLQTLEEFIVWSRKEIYIYGLFADIIYRSSLHLVIFFLCLGYVFHHKSIAANASALKAKNALTEMHLKLLQHQIDPHFLFNNLNVLSSLIPPNADKAHKYLEHLSELYHYLLRNKDRDVVMLSEEWNFTKSYIYLLKERFDGIYDFQITLQNNELDVWLMPPMVMQELIMNAVKHNDADSENPLLINIIIGESFVEVSNEQRLKEKKSTTTGTGLNNMLARFKLLSDEQVLIEQKNNNFVVRLPLLKLLNQHARIDS